MTEKAKRQLDLNPQNTRNIAFIVGWTIAHLAFYLTPLILLISLTAAVSPLEMFFVLPFPFYSGTAMAFGLAVGLIQLRFLQRFRSLTQRMGWAAMSMIGGVGGMLLALYLLAFVNSENVMVALFTVYGAVLTGIAAMQAFAKPRYNLLSFGDSLRWLGAHVVGLVWGALILGLVLLTSETSTARPPTSLDILPLVIALTGYAALMGWLVDYRWLNRTEPPPVRKRKLRDPLSLNKQLKVPDEEITENWWNFGRRWEFTTAYVFILALTVGVVSPLHTANWFLSPILPETFEVSVTPQILDGWLWLIVQGALFGLAMSVAQFTLFNEREGYWWMVASPIGATLGVIVGAVLIDLVNLIPFPFLRWTYITRTVFLLGFGITLGAVQAALGAPEGTPRSARLRWFWTHCIWFAAGLFTLGLGVLATRFSAPQNVGEGVGWNAFLWLIVVVIYLHGTGKSAYDAGYHIVGHVPRKSKEPNLILESE